MLAWLELFKFLVCNGANQKEVISTPQGPVKAAQVVPEVFVEYHTERAIALK